jgi:hypothetical protein
MKNDKQLICFFGVGVVFTLTQIIIEILKLSDILNPVLGLSMMLMAQLIAFVILKRHFTNGKKLRYLNILTIFVLLKYFPSFYFL